MRTIACAPPYAPLAVVVLGALEIALDARQSPKTVSSFTYLARNGVYDHTTFYRIVPSFVILGGDPLGIGTGGPGYSIEEKPPRRPPFGSADSALARQDLDWRCGPSLLPDLLRARRALGGLRNQLVTEAARGVTPAVPETRHHFR
jgi:Cyclophilin type peptidyl-prolyl cis-trans isomerase/CLD